MSEYAKHNLDALLADPAAPFETLTGQNYAHPVPSQLADGATFVVTPYPECQGCPRAGEENHDTHWRWDCWKPNGKRWTANCAWGDQYVPTQPAWLTRAQALLYWYNRIPSGLAANGLLPWPHPHHNHVLIDCLGIRHAGVGIWENEQYEFVSAVDNKLTIRRQPDAPDFRRVLDGPVLRGYLVSIWGNNCWSDRGDPIIIGIEGADLADPHTESFPDEITLVLDQTIAPAINTQGRAWNYDEDERFPHTVEITISRRAIEQPWKYMAYDGNQVMATLTTAVEYTPADPEWVSRVFPLSADHRVALPDENKTGDARTLIVEFDGADVTASVPGLYDYQAGALKITNTPSAALDLSAMSLDGVSSVEITFELEANDQFGGAVHPQYMGARCCKHSKPDMTATWGIPGPNGWTWFCARYLVASGIDNFAEGEGLCFLCGNCSHFEPLERADFVSKQAYQQAIQQIWFGGFAVKQQWIMRGTIFSAYLILPAGVASITGLVSHEEMLVNADTEHARIEVYRGARFGVWKDDDWFAQGLAHEEPYDGLLPDVLPSAGALCWQMSENDQWEKNKRSLLDNVVLTDDDDPTGEYRRFPLNNSPQGYRDIGFGPHGHGPMLHQARGCGWNNAEDVLLGKVPGTRGKVTTQTDGQAYRGWLTAGLEPTSNEEEAVSGALLRFKPMPHSSLDSPFVQFQGQAITARLYKAEPVGTEENPLYRLTLYGNRTDFRFFHAYVDESGLYPPAWLELSIPFYAGGNFCGLAQYQRIRNYAANQWLSQTGQIVGARPGMTVAFFDPPTYTSWAIAKPVFGGPQEFLVTAAEPFAGTEEKIDWYTGQIPIVPITDPESRYQGDNYYNKGPYGGAPSNGWFAQSLRWNEEMDRLPQNAHEWLNRPDQVVVADDGGYLAAALAAGTVVPGNELPEETPWTEATAVALRIQASFAHNAGPCHLTDAQLFWAPAETDDWTEITEHMTVVSPVNGLIALSKAICETLTPGTICFRLHAANGRYGSSSWIWP